MNPIRITKRENQPTIGAKHLLNSLKGLEPGDYSVTIEDWKDSRSINQNSLYWKWISIIGDELGYYKNEMHETFLDAFAPIQTFRDLHGRPKQKPIRSSQMNVEQMSEYMTQIDQFAAEQGIVLPRPEEQLLQQPKRKTA